MKAKHTPGPWIMGEAKNGGYWVRKDATSPVVYVAEVPQQLDWYQTGANARLIAAAPELLSIARMWEDELTAPVTDKDALLALVRHVIAKAEGRE
jgi:hypothetical protein